MTLKYNGHLANFYRNFYNTVDLPNNLCNFFWLYLIAIICYPLFWPSIIINNIYTPIQLGANLKYKIYNRRIPTYIGVFANIILMFTGAWTADCLNIHFSNTFPICDIIIFIMLGTITCICFFYLFVILIKFYNFLQLYKKREKSIEILNERLKINEKERSFFFLLKERIKAFKDKNCPMITWEK